MQRYWLLWIVVLAFLLRTIGITSYPIGFTTDEASFGYDAYSILKTGKDQWGEPWPLTLRASGDFKLPLYSYITVPFVAVFGLSEFAVRLPNALFGTLAVFVAYLMVLGFFGNRKFALWSAFLLSISPWHISLSRGAFEMNLMTFFVPLAIWAFLRGIRNSRWMVISAFVFGLNLFSYHSARLLTPFLVLALVMVAYRKLVLGVYVHRDPLFLITVFLVLLGVQFILMGLIAELVVRTYFESQKKSIYEIKRERSF